VREHTGGNAVTRLLTDAAMADLRNTGTRQAFLEHAPGIVEKLALIDPSKADFLCSRDIPLEQDHVIVRAMLNARGRTAVAVVEELCGCPLPQAIGPAVRQLIAATRESVTETLMGIEHVYGFASKDALTIDYMTPDINALDFSRSRTALTVTFDGPLEARLRAAVLQHRPGARQTTRPIMRSLSMATAGNSYCTRLTTPTDTSPCPVVSA
jgi:hypothetical protein